MLNPRGTQELYAPWANAVSPPPALYDPTSPEAPAVMYAAEKALLAMGVKHPVVGLYSQTDAEKSATLNQKFNDGVAQIVLGATESRRSNNSSAIGGVEAANRSARNIKMRYKRAAPERLSVTTSDRWSWARLRRRSWAGDGHGCRSQATILASSARSTRISDVPHQSTGGVDLFRAQGPQTLP